MQCTGCPYVNPQGALFCGQCGAKLGPSCPACGAAVAAGQKFCSGCGHALAAAEPAAQADTGERRYATVLFSDLNGYTTLNERVDAELVEEIMTRVKRAATTIIERHGGTINQFVGDEVFALFGVPLARRDDPQRAVLAAMELHRAVEEISNSAETATGHRLTMHSGINSGPVLVRRSDSHAGKFMLTGDTVNTGARLLKLASLGEVVVGPETWRQVSGFFEAHEGTPVQLKGKDKPLVPYRIQGVREATEAGARRLVGRSEEIQQLAGLARACEEYRRGRVVVLRGDPGIGKTRLASEFLSVLRNQGFACHQARVLDFGTGSGRDAVRSLVQSLLDVRTDAEDDVRRDAVARAREQGLIGADRALFLYDLVDVAPPTEQRMLHSAMSVEARQRGTLESLGELARNASTHGPLALLVEDVHWADAATLERLAALAVAAAANPVLFVMTTRFEGDPTIGAWRGTLRGIPMTGIDLGPLSAEDAARFAAEVSQMPESIVRTCIQRAEGNPLLLEQLLINAEGAAIEKLPGTIQALVLARMDRLDALDRSALQAAAVLGQRFSLAALRHLIDNSAYDCAALEAHFLVRAEGAEHVFCHALIRDGARASLLKSRRKQLHARAATWFKERDLVLAAEHFERAESPETARAHLAASESEASQFRYDSALSLTERGLAAATEPADRCHLLVSRARLLLEMGRAQESVEAGRAALEAATDAAGRAEALIAMAAAMRINDRVDDGLAALDEAQPHATQSGLPQLLSRLHHLRGNLFFPLGRVDECLREHRFALVHAKEAGSVEAEAAALGGLGDAHYLGGRMRSAYDQFEKCVSLCRRHGLGRLEVSFLHMMGWTAIYLMDTGAVVQFATEAATLAAKVSHLRSEILSRSLAGYIDGHVRGNIGPARQQLETALTLAQTLGAKRFEAQIQQFRAMLASRAGEDQLALDLAGDALRICAEHGMGFTGAWLHGVLAGLAPDPETRERALTDGEKLLANGCVSHNYFHFYDNAIEVSLDRQAWDAAERYCGKLEAYAAMEALPWSEFIVARGRTLVRIGRGERGPELAESLRRLRADAVRAELNNAIPKIDAAIEGLN